MFKYTLEYERFLDMGSYEQQIAKTSSEYVFPTEKTFQEVKDFSRRANYVLGVRIRALTFLDHQAQTPTATVLHPG